MPQLYGPRPIDSRRLAEGDLIGLEGWSTPFGAASLADGVQATWRHLRHFLLETGHIVPIRRYDERLLGILTTDVLARIQSGDASWEDMVPPAVAQTIKAKRLFGYSQAQVQP